MALVAAFAAIFLGGLKRWAAVLAFGVVGANEFDQHSPGYHPIQLGQQLLLAGLLGAQVQVKAALLHACKYVMTELLLSD